MEPLARFIIDDHIHVDVIPVTYRQGRPVNCGVDLICDHCGHSVTIVALGPLQQCIEVAHFVHDMIVYGTVVDDVCLHRTVYPEKPVIVGRFGLRKDD